MIEIVLSLAVLAAFALVAGGLWLIVKGRDARRGALMLGAAAVTIANILILAWPAGGRL